MNSGKPKDQAVAIAMNVKRRRKMAHGGEAGNPELAAAHERSSYGAEQTACEHGSEWAECPMCNDSDNMAPGRFAEGGLVPDQGEMSHRNEPGLDMGLASYEPPRLREEDNNYEDGHDLELAKSVMQRRQVQGLKPAANGLMNYAKGGPVQGTMQGRAGADDGSERTPGRGDNTQRDGRLRPNNQELDDNGLIKNNNSDFEDDDMLSGDGEGSLFTGNSLDNTEGNADDEENRKRQARLARAMRS